MRIEKRDGEEWLVDAPNCSGCSMESPGGGTCTQHLDGHHLATGFPRDEGEPIFERWPIEPAQPTPDPFALGIVEGLRRIEGMMRDLDRRVVFAERKLKLLTERIAAEIADVSEAIERQPAAEPTRGES